MQTSGNTVEEFNDQFGHVVAWCSLFSRKETSYEMHWRLDLIIAALFPIKSTCTFILEV